MDTLFFLMLFIIGPIALIIGGIIRVMVENNRAKEEYAKNNRPLTFEEKVERALTRKQEAMAIKKEVARRIAAQDQ